MSFRGQELYKKAAKRLASGKLGLTEEGIETVKKCMPNSKVVMSRAKRGIFAGRHIQFGNQISEDGGNKSRRTWKPNVQGKRLFSYIHDRHIQVKVTTHALRCIDKAGGIDEYLLKTPYEKMDSELGVLWKARIEKMYAELGKMDVGFFSPEEEGKIEKGFEKVRAAKREARKESRKAMLKQEGDVAGQSNKVEEKTNAEQIENKTE